jgi:hypothetical protein
VQPWQQRAHLWSAYIELVGGQFGLDGVVAAKGDRFLEQALREVRLDPRSIVQELRRDMDVKEFLQNVLADVNNQSAVFKNSERLIDRTCIFEWVRQNLGDKAQYEVFYDEDRAEEFADLDPKEPTLARHLLPHPSAHTFAKRRRRTLSPRFFNNKTLSRNARAVTPAELTLAPLPCGVLAEPRTSTSHSSLRKCCAISCAGPTC